MKQFIIAMAAMACLAGNANAKELRVLQWNIWQEGTKVPGGYEAIVDEIVRLNPDFVTLSEVRNYNDSDFTARLVASLAERDREYHSFYSYDTGLLSRYELTDTMTVFPEHNDHGSIYRLTAEVEPGLEVAVYTAHLDYLDDAYYNVRGYDGSTWAEVALPQTVEEVLERNIKSQRDDATSLFIAQAHKDLAQGRQVILGGDFNEPSHLDWTEATKHLYDHHGMVIPWTVTTMLAEAGFADAWRTVYPDPLTHPGFTYPSDNKALPPAKITWAPKADERERIDYLWFAAPAGMTMTVSDVALFGPDSSIVRNERVKDSALCPFITPLGVWPTDHKALIATFRITR